MLGAQGTPDRTSSMRCLSLCVTRLPPRYNRVQKTAQAIAALDVLCALADVACDNNYVCPVVDFSDRIDIKDGRHPVVEKMLSDSLFIPNDTLLDRRETALLSSPARIWQANPPICGRWHWITIMAQIGSYVPASSAHIGGGRPRVYPCRRVG